MVKAAKFEGYYDDAKADFDNLEKKLTHNTGKDLDRNKELIKHVMASDIVAAYYYQKGSIENGLNYDKTLKEAVRLLSTPEEYGKILFPKAKRQLKSR